MLAIARRLLSPRLVPALPSLKVMLPFSGVPYVFSFKFLLLFLDIIDVDGRISAQGGSGEVSLREGSHGVMQEVKALVRPEF